MITEILYFQVTLAERAAWIAQDAAVWTAFLQQQAGFLRKELWISDATTNELCTDELCIVIWWESAAAMQTIPQAALIATEQAMAEFARDPIRVEIKEVVKVA